MSMQNSPRERGRREGKEVEILHMEPINQGHNKNKAKTYLYLSTSHVEGTLVREELEPLVRRRLEPTERNRDG